LFKDILGVGGLSSLGTVQANLTVAIFTALAGAFGTDAIAGYGVAARLDYMQIPLLFGLGTATVTLVGTNIGAGRIDRARRATWTAAGLAFAVTQIIGIAAAVFPHAWLGIFTADPNVLAVGTRYLQIVAPFYGVVGFAFMLYFASQGAKRVALPVMAGTVRLIIAATGGWLVAHLFAGDLQSLFVVTAISSIAFSVLITLSVALRPWSRAT
jgi:Na+-driven multidrug efflux pump